MVEYDGVAYINGDNGDRGDDSVFFTTITADGDFIDVATVVTGGVGDGTALVTDIHGSGSGGRGGVTSQDMLQHVPTRSLRLKPRQPVFFNGETRGQGVERDNLMKHIV